MNVDEALTHGQVATSLGCRTDNENCIRVLGNEVWRLRAAIKEYAAEVCSLDSQNTKLRAENAELLERVGALKSDQTFAAGEAKALRAENAQLRKQNDQLHDVTAMYELKARQLDEVRAENDQLKTENAILRGLDKKSDEVREVRDEVIDRLVALEAENAELRERDCRLSTQVEQLREDSADERVEALKAKLAWFEDFASVVSVVTARFMVAKGNGSDVIDAVNGLITWEREHPKPEGT